MLSCIMLALALGLALQTVTPTDFTKGSHLFGSCQSAVRMMDNPSAQQTKTEMPGSTYCLGYVGGYIDGLNRLKDAVCVRDATLNTIVRVYVAYMQKNPKLMDEGKALGLLLALTDAYACPK